VSWEYRTITVWRSYDSRARDYDWVEYSSTKTITGWADVLAYEAERGWELVSSCVESYLEGNSSMEATGYRLFFKRPR
jgi:hypothetical protein